MGLRDNLSSFRRRATAALLLASLALAACGGSATPAGGSPTSPGSKPPGGSALPTGGPVAKATDGCGILGPGDFAAAGVAGAGQPTVNPDPTGAYCVYAGKSGATGGIEFDVFQGASVDDALGIFESIRSFIDDGTGKTALPEADQAAFMLKTSDKPAWVAIAVRKGRLAFGISFPAGDGSKEKLVALAKLVIARGANLEK